VTAPDELVIAALGQTATKVFSINAGDKLEVKVRTASFSGH